MDKLLRVNPPPVADPAALKALLIQKDRQLMTLVNKVDNVRRTAKRGLRLAKKQDGYGHTVYGRGDYIDLFQHILDEVGGTDGS